MSYTGRESWRIKQKNKRSNWAVPWGWSRRGRKGTSWFCRDTEGQSWGL